MRRIRLTLPVLAGMLVWGFSGAVSQAASLPGVSLNLTGTSSPAGVVGTLQIIVLLALLSFAPAILVMMTAFTRVIVILSFVRSALATQSAPPNQVLIGLALFLTLFIMTPTFSAVNNQALQPYLAGHINQTVALERGEMPFKEFMAKQTRIDDVELFLQYQHLPLPKTLTDLPITTLVPAFAISELKTAFQIGFMIYVPFLIVDLVVATTLMSMNMMMLPPVLISTPFKLLLFVMVNGWYLVVKSILAGFH
ncbi:MAG: flagellar type III secretion system pore protein FliP [Firmicutes bacterium]|nr:flagellar type III secretion system pore protein FliP [Bacillota bacterium]